MPYEYVVSYVKERVPGRMSGMPEIIGLNVVRRDEQGIEMVENISRGTRPLYNDYFSYAGGLYEVFGPINNVDELTTRDKVTTKAIYQALGLSELT